VDALGRVLAARAVMFAGAGLLAAASSTQSASGQRGVVAAALAAV
jgi:hypothetical protein